MSKVSSWLICLSIFASYFIGASAEDIGKVLPQSTVDMWLPYEVGLLILIPAFFGYMAGKESS